MTAAENAEAMASALGGYRLAYLCGIFEKQYNESGAEESNVQYRKQ